AQVRRLAGTQRATMAANGIDVGSGTALALVDETYTLGEQGALTIRYNAMNEAWGHRETAAALRQQGQFAKVRGNAASQNTYLTTAATVGGQYAEYLQRGGKRRALIPKPCCIYWKRPAAKSPLSGISALILRCVINQLRHRRKRLQERMLILGDPEQV